MAFRLALYNEIRKGTFTGDGLLQPIEDLWVELEKVPAVETAKPFDQYLKDFEPGDNDLKRHAADELSAREAVNNPVARYLREMSRFRLLTAEKEVKIARQIEIGEMKLLRAILQSTIALEYIIDLGYQIESGQQAAGRVLMHIHSRGRPISLQEKVDLFLKTTRLLKKRHLFVKNCREEKVLRLRFGIGEKRDHTLDEISRKFDLTRERIRQIEARALQKLQRSKYSDNLRSFLDR